MVTPKLQAAFGRNTRERISRVALGSIFAHQQWLATEGQAGHQLQRPWFNECMLDGADFSRAMIVGGTFAFSSLKRAKFVDADLCRANFMWADVDGADFTRANLQGALFSKDASLKAHFKDANTEGMLWAGNDEDLAKLEDPTSPLHEEYFQFWSQKTYRNPGSNDWERDGHTIYTWYADRCAHLLRSGISAQPADLNNLSL